jgi:hypothetical protein
VNVKQIEWLCQQIIIILQYGWQWRQVGVRDLAKARQTGHEFKVIGLAMVWYTGHGDMLMLDVWSW